MAILKCTILIVLHFCSPSMSGNLGGILCRMPKSEGVRCGRIQPYNAYYFDSESGNCIQFEFQGCGGNSNRFSSREECWNGCGIMTLCSQGPPLMDFAGNIKRCDGDRMPCPGSHECVGRGMESVCCHKADRVCKLPVDSGTICGVPSTSRFFFDSSSNTCRSFSFSGCGGNENNFRTKGMCVQFCSEEVTCKRGEPLPDRYSPSRPMNCHQNEHCPSNYTCSLNGRGRGSCCPSREMVCGISLNSRESCTSSAEGNGWTFDVGKGICEKIRARFCPGSLNLFPNVEQCVEYCIGSCPNSEISHLNTKTGHPLLCNAKAEKACPIGYKCIKTSEFTSICCRSPFPQCPNGGSAVRLNGKAPMECSSSRQCPSPHSCEEVDDGDDDECALGHSVSEDSGHCSWGNPCPLAFCQNQIEWRSRRVCCASPSSCPVGMSPVEEGDRPRGCTPTVEGTCPKESLCVPGEGGESIGRHLCCKPQQKCVVPFVDSEDKRPQPCLPGDGRCPFATNCLPILEVNEFVGNVSELTFFCCHQTDVFSCSEGRTPLQDLQTKRPKKCRPSDPISCPVDFQCELLSDGTSVCCPHPAAEQKCLEAIMNDGDTVVCDGWSDNSCPGDSKCRKSSDGRYVCCLETSEDFLRLFEDVMVISH